MNFAYVGGKMYGFHSHQRHKQKSTSKLTTAPNFEIDFSVYLSSRLCLEFCFVLSRNACQIDNN